MAQSTMDSEAVGLQGDCACESGGIAGGDSLPRSLGGRRETPDADLLSMRMMEG